MSISPPFLAQNTLPVDVVSAPWQNMDATTRDILIILGAVAAVTLLALFWVLAFKSRRRRRHHSHHQHHHSQERSEPTVSPDSEDIPVSETRMRRRRRHRRREHRPRNPTLAETGGLPPLRTTPPPEP